MIKWKSIVLVLVLMLMVCIIDHPIFGQQKAFPKKDVQQLQLTPGLCIPQPAAAAPKLLQLSSTMGPTKPMAKLDHQKVMQYFAQAAQAMNVPSATPDFTSAFTFSPSKPLVPGRGGISYIYGAYVVSFHDTSSGSAYFDKPGDGSHFVQFRFHAQKGLYLVNCDVPGNLEFFAQISAVPTQTGAGLKNLKVSGKPTYPPGIFSFPVYILQESDVIITFGSPMKPWWWDGCEIIPQS
jgi:hypothetical protein